MISAKEQTLNRTDSVSSVQKLKWTNLYDLTKMFCTWIWPKAVKFTVLASYRVSFCVMPAAVTRIVLNRPGLLALQARIYNVVFTRTRYVVKSNGHLHVFLLSRIWQSSTSSENHSTSFFTCLISLLILWQNKLIMNIYKYVKTVITHHNFKPLEL